MTDFKKILLTGASGFIGSYILEELRRSGYEPDTLSRRPGATYLCDLEHEAPRLNGVYDTVIHAAGTDEADRADALNHEGTRRLLSALEAAPPRRFTYLSSVHVYGLDPGTDVTESCFLRPDTPYARSKIRAEKLLEKWCTDHDVVLTILRPAITVGRGMHGRLARMAHAVARGRYMHLRGNQAVRSLVMADDVARAVALTLGSPGVFNVTDGRDHSVIAMADAMALNLGTDKRVLSMPAGLVKWGLRLCPLPGLKKAVATLTASATFSNRALVEATGLEPYDTLEVMARRHPSYPYREL